MRIFHVAYYTILRNIRDKKSLASMLLLPIVLIIILGTALNGAYSTRNMNRIPVVYFNEDKDIISGYFEDFLESEEVKKMLKVEKAASIDEGMILVNDKKAHALIVINKGYSEAIKSGKKADIEIFAGEYSSFRSSVVKNLIDSYIEGANTVGAMRKLNASEENYARTESIVESPITTKGKRPGAIDYYAVTSLVMTLMFGAQYAVNGIGEDYLGDKGKRARTTPMKPYEQFIGITLGNVFTIICQAVVLVMFTKYVYKANWGGSIPGILAISFTLSVLSTGIGILTTVLIKDKARAASLLNIAIPVMSFLAGGLVKLEVGNSLFARLMYISPNYLAQTALFNTIYGQTVTTNIQLLSTAGCIIALWIITAVIFIIASIFGRRELA